MHGTFNLPEEFIASIKKQIPNLADGLFEALEIPASSFVRNNIYRNPKYRPSEEYTAVPWCPHGFELEERPVFTLDPKFHGGAYYVQESSSMFLYHVLKNLPIQVKDNPKVLDLCGAPGGKSTAILDFLDGKGLLVANEVIQSRVAPLKQNIMKWGHANAVVTNDDPIRFSPKLDSYFDVVVVDAPCSGEGMFRKDPKARSKWSLDNVNLCQSRQRRILSDIIPVVKNGGFLIYSTCTFNHKENAQNIEWLRAKGFESRVVNIEEDWGIIKLNNGEDGYQFLPGRVNGEGFFIAILQKIQGEVPKKTKYKDKLINMEIKELAAVKPFLQNEDLLLKKSKYNDAYAYSQVLGQEINFLLDSGLKIKYSGIKCGQLNKRILIPDHALALMCHRIGTIPTIELELSSSLEYLRKELTRIDIPEKGWITVSYKGTVLGWAKNLGNRINNYLPNDWRIKMR